jgi:hypothetical protein
MEHAWAPCSDCVRKTTHEVLHRVGYTTEEHVVETYMMLRCCGCGAISLSKETEDIATHGTVLVYYPSPVSRKKPSWLLALVLGVLGGPGDEKLGDLMHEIYQAVDGGQHRLAAMGIRALLEQVMIAKVGDNGSFSEKMERFHEKGYISLIQRDAMRETIEVGHAAMHRSFAPSEQELNTALDIVEGIMAAVFDHSEAAMTLAKRVPQRVQGRSKKK